MESATSDDAQLDSLLVNMKPEIKSPVDVMAVVVHSLVLDLGFTMSGNPESPLELARTPAGLVFHYNYLDTQTRMQLTIFSLGQTLQIHCHLPANSESFTLHIKKLDEFVTEDLKLVNYKKLKSCFTSSVGNRLRHKARLLAGLEKGLLELPEDVLRTLFKHLDYKAVINLSSVNNRLWTLGRETLLWKYLLKIHYPDVVLEKNQDPYERFVNETKKVLLRKKKSRSLVLYRDDPLGQPFFQPRHGGGGGPNFPFHPPPFF